MTDEDEPAFLLNILCCCHGKINKLMGVLYMLVMVQEAFYSIILCIL